MTTVPLTAPGGGQETTADDGVRGVVASPEEPVVGFLELSERVVASAFGRAPWLHRAILAALGLCTLVCLIGTVTRLSPLPLLPVPLFALGWYASRRMRGAADRRRLLQWTGLFGVALLTGFWLISVVARWVQ